MTWARLTVDNHRGIPVPRVLGLWLAGFGVASTAAVALADVVTTSGWIAAGGAFLVFAAGLTDDLAPAGPRGIRGHLAALMTGHVSTGIVKLVVIAGASVVVVAGIPARASWARVAGVVLLAGATNLWNGLDVRPGRALKFFLPVALVVLSTAWTGQPFLPGIALGALVLLPWDAGERAMLGDAGANVIGFVAGLGLVHQLHGAALAAVAVAMVVLNVVAETVTLSRLIARVPPLRWYDALGTTR